MFERFFSFIVSFYLFLTYLFTSFGVKFEKNSSLAEHNMGRSRLPLELIPKEKSRKITFQKRTMGLKKKTYEISTLCGVDACVRSIVGRQMIALWNQYFGLQILRR